MFATSLILAAYIVVKVSKNKMIVLIANPWNINDVAAISIPIYSLWRYVKEVFPNFLDFFIVYVPIS